MGALQDVFLVLMYWMLPILIIFLCDRYRWMKKTGDIVFAYLAGLIIGHTGFLTDSAAAIQEAMFALTIPIAIPLMLFNSEVKQWFVGSRGRGAVESAFLGSVAIKVLAGSKVPVTIVR